MTQWWDQHVAETDAKMAVAERPRQDWSQFPEAAQQEQDWSQFPEAGSEQVAPPPQTIQPTETQAELEARDPALVDKDARYAVSLLREYAGQYRADIPQDKWPLYVAAGTLFDEWKKANPEKAKQYEALDNWRQNIVIEPPAVGEYYLGPEFAERSVSSVAEAMVIHKKWPTKAGYEVVKGVHRRLPFSPRRTWEAGREFTAKRRVKKGNVTPEDWMVLAGSIDEAERREDWGTLRKIADAVSELPAYGIEIGFTGGIYTGAKTAITKGLTKAAPRLAATLPGKVATAVVPRAGAVGVQTLAITNRLAENLVKAYTPKHAPQQTAEGQIKLWIDTHDPSLIEAAWKGGARAYIEVGSERAGFLVGKASKPLGRLFNKIPGASRVAALKGAILNRLLKKGRTFEQIGELFKKGQWHGLLGESFEERIGEGARGVLGFEEGFGTMGAILSGDPEGWKQLFIETTALAVPGAGRAAVGTLSRLAEGLAPSRKQVEALGGLPEGQADTEANRRKWAEDNKEDIELAAAIAKQFKEKQEAKEKEDAVPRKEEEVQPTEEVKPEEEAPAEGEVPVEEAVEEEPTVEEPGEAAPEAPVEEPPVEEPEVKPKRPLKKKPEEAPEIVEPSEPEPENVWRAKHVDDWLKEDLVYVAKSFGLKLSGLRKAELFKQIKEVEKNILDYAKERGIKPPMLLQAVELALAAEREKVADQKEGLKRAYNITKLTPDQIEAIENTRRDLDDVPHYDEALDEIQRAYPGLLVDPQNPDANPADVLWELLKKSQRDFILPRADAMSVLEAAEALLQGTDYRVPEKVIKATPEEVEQAFAKAEAEQPDISAIDEAAAMALLRKPEPRPARAPRAPREPAPEPSLEPTSAGQAARQEAIRSLREDLGGAIGNLTAILEKRAGTATMGGLDRDILEALAKIVVQAAKSSAKLGKAALLTFGEFMAQVPAEFHKFEPQLRAQWERLRIATKGHRLAPLGEAPPLFAEKPPVKPSEPEGDLVGIAKQLVTEFREKHGLPGFEGVTPQTFKETLEAAKKLLADDPTLPATLLAELAAAEARALTPIEIAVITLYKRRLVNKIDHALATMVSTTEPAQQVEAENTAQGLLAVIDNIDQLTTAPEAAGTVAGRQLVFRKMALAADFSLEGLVRRHTKAKGERLTTDEVSALKTMADQFKQLEARLEEIEVQAAIDAEIAKSQPRKKLSPAERKATAGERVRTAAASFLEKWGALGAVGRFQDPKKEAQKKRELLDAGVELVRACIELGARTFSEFLARAKASIGADIGEMRASLKQAWDKVQATGEVPQVKVKRDSPESIGRLARKLTAAVVESGTTDREKVVDAVHEELREILGEEWTRRQTMDAISGYGKFKELSKDDISKEIRRISGELQQLAKLEDMAAGKAPKKTGIERREVGEGERHLITEVNEAKKRGGYEITDPERQLKTAIGSAKTAVRNRISDLQQEISSRERIVKERKPLKADTELEALRKQRDELKTEWDKVFPKEPLTDQQRAQRAAKALDRVIRQIEADLKADKIWPGPKAVPISTPQLEAKRAELEALRAEREELRNQDDPNRVYRTGLQKRLADMKERIANKDFARKPVKERTLNKEELDLLYEYEQTQKKEREMRRTWERSRRTRPAKIAGAIVDLLNIFRPIQISEDMSALLRQAKFLLASHPILTLKTLGPGFKAAWSKKQHFASAERIRRHPMYHLLVKRAGLNLTEIGGPLTKQEEFYMGNWTKYLAKYIPGFAMSERGYITLLNEVRFNAALLLTQTLGGESGPTVAEATVVAHGINASTGRPSLGKVEPAAGLLAAILYSPRHAWSRVLMAIGEPVWGWKAGYKGTGKARLLLAKEYARTIVGLWVYTQLLRMLLGDDEEEATVDWNPISSDIGKVRVGNTRIDVLAGLAQFFRLGARIATGKTKTAEGKIVPIRGEGARPFRMTVRSQIKDFLEYKLAPVPSAVLDILSGETVMHEEVTFWGEVGTLTTPLVVRDIVEAMQDLGVKKGTAVGILAFFGEAVNVWEKKQRKRRRRRIPGATKSSF